MNAKVVRECAECGVVIRVKRDQLVCRGCCKTFCPPHTFQLVDESNESITKHAPLLCRSCYRERYP